MYTIVYKISAEKELKKIPKKDQQKIENKIEALQNIPRPHGAIKMKGENDLYRMRYGNYRVVYSIIDSLLCIEIIKIRHR